MAAAFLRSSGPGSLLPLPAQECHISLCCCSADAAEVTGVARPAEVTLELPGLEQEWQQEAPHKALVFLAALHPDALRDAWHRLRNGTQVMAEAKFADKVGLT